jgi:ribose transport system permease protein
MESQESPSGVSWRGLFKKYGLILIALFIVAFFSMLNPVFLTATTLLNVLRQVSMLGIVAVGVTCVMITGGIDITVGSMLSIINVVTATFMVKLGVDPVLACLAAVALGALLGLMNGLIITYLDIPPFIETLAMMTTIRGVSFIISKGLPIYGFPDSFSVLAQGYVAGIPLPVIIMAFVFLLGAFFLNRTYVGRFLFAIGGNEEAARLSGIPVRKLKILVYVVSGTLAALAGLILLSRISSGQPNTGSGFEMDVITAIVLGGVSMSGGQGSILGVLTGVVIIGLLSSGMVIIGMSEYYQWVVKGLVLIAAVAIDRSSKRKA